jgi:hypothetical protein
MKWRDRAVYENWRKATYWRNVAIDALLELGLWRQEYGNRPISWQSRYQLLKSDYSHVRRLYSRSTAARRAVTPQTNYSDVPDET